jgi:hypothetical protein
MSGHRRRFHKAYKPIAHNNPLRRRKEGMKAYTKVLRLVLFSVVAVLLLGLLASGAEAYTVVDGWVWHGRAKIQWNPTLPGGVGCGDMRQPVRYTITNPGAQPAIVADAQNTQAFNAANAWDGGTGGIINYYFSPGEVDITWAAGVQEPGAAADFGANPDTIRLNIAHTIRSDLWTVIPPGGPNQYDMYTTLVHEFGHDLGLDHREQTATIMTPQDLARGNNWWAAAPPPPAPLGVPAGSTCYFDPRAVLTADDILGAKTLYTVPTPNVVAVPPIRNPNGNWVYHYRVSNGAPAGTDHYISAFTVPLPAGSGPATVITVTPVGWAGAIVGNTVVWTAGAVAAYIAPGGGPLDFEFQNPNPPAMGAPATKWSWPHLATEEGQAPNGDFSGDTPVENTTLAFDPNNAWIVSEDVYVPGSASVNPTVGGYSFSIDKHLAHAPDVSLAFTILLATVASAVHVKRNRCRKEKN